jgi:acyl dehydratase
MAPPVVIPCMAATPYYQGVDFGTTRWITITQDRIDLFARTTGDVRWIHVDAERAARESPWKSTVADGYLLLSLIPSLLTELIVVIGWSTAINTGIDGCQFPGVVTAGTRVRMGSQMARARLLSGNGCRIGFDIRFEVEGSDTPACLARVNYAYFE